MQARSESVALASAVRSIHPPRELDWLHRLRFVDATDADARRRLAPELSEDAVMREMYVVEPGGGRHAGYDGILRIAREVPPMWPLRFIGMLPGLGHIGRRVYGRIASARHRDGPCRTTAVNSIREKALPFESGQFGVGRSIESTTSTCTCVRDGSSFSPSWVGKASDREGRSEEGASARAVAC